MGNNAGTGALPPPLHAVLFFGFFFAGSLGSGSNQDLSSSQNEPRRKEFFPKNSQFPAPVPQKWGYFWQKMGEQG